MTETEVKKIFSKFSKTNVLVIGDVMLDAYSFGKVSRISPEAPVPVVEIIKKEIRLGGAANVALNLKALEANVIVCACVGNDEAGKQLNKLLKENKIDNSGIFVSKNRPTTIKTRIIGGNHQMLRIDEEITAPLSTPDKKIFSEKLLKIINTTKIDVILFEDYDKGLLSEDLIAQVISVANNLGIPTVVDPKKNNFLAYKNVSLFKPNLKEIREGLQIDFDAGKESELKSVLSRLQKTINCDAILLTLSEKGIVYFSAKEYIKCPAHVRAIADVSGAGDTVVSVASLSVANKLSHQLTAQMSNLAGGLVCEKIGVVPIDKNTLMKEVIELLQ